jgi:hypothetical protein
MPYALCGLTRKVVFPDLLDPIDQLPEIIEEGHFVKIVFEGDGSCCLNKSSATFSKARLEFITSDRLSPAGPKGQIPVRDPSFIVESAMEATNTFGIPQLNRPLNLFIHGLTDHPL